MESRKEAFKASIVQQIRRGNGGNLNNSYEAIPETNVFFAPENRGDSELGNHHFQGRTVSFREGKPLLLRGVVLTTYCS